MIVWKKNHEFNYCNLVYLIMCRIDNVWLLNLFLFEITECFRLSCHDDVNDSKHYSESFHLDEDFPDSLTSLIITIKKTNESKNGRRMKTFSEIGTDSISNEIIFNFWTHFMIIHVPARLTGYRMIYDDWDRSSILRSTTYIISTKILSITIFTSRARLGPIYLRALMRYATRVEDTDMLMMTSEFL